MNLSYDNGFYVDLDGGGERVFTAYCSGGEEIDVRATTRLHARRIAALAIERDYEDGMRIRALSRERVGWYM